MSIEEVENAMASLTVAASDTIGNYADTRVRGYLKEHPDIIEHRLDLLTLMIDQVHAAVAREREAHQFPPIERSELDSAHAKYVTEYEAHTCTCGYCLHGSDEEACGQVALAATRTPTPEPTPRTFEDIVSFDEGLSPMYRATVRAEQEDPHACAAVLGMEAWTLLDADERKDSLVDLLQAYVEIVQHQRDGRPIR